MARLLKRYGPISFWVVLVGLIVVVHFYKGRDSSEISIESRPPAVDDPFQSQLRTGYKGALIKWGITSAEDFERARAHDPEIEEACQVGFLHPVVLKEDVWRSVAYRQIPYEEHDGAFQKGSRIFWTGLIKISAGELVFEDKDGNIVRGRCGNCSRTSAPKKTFVPPPVAAELDTPIAEFAPPRIIFPLPQPVGWPTILPEAPIPYQPLRIGERPIPGQGGPFIPPLIVGIPPIPASIPPGPGTAPPVGGTPFLPPGTPIPFPPVPVNASPEPHTGVLLISALGALAILKASRNRRTRK